MHDNRTMKESYATYIYNQTHKIVHSSTICTTKNLIIIHECSKKLLKMKNSKSFC